MYSSTTANANRENINSSFLAVNYSFCVVILFNVRFVFTPTTSTPLSFVVPPTDVMLVPLILMTIIAVVAVLIAIAVVIKYRRKGKTTKQQ